MGKKSQTGEAEVAKRDHGPEKQDAQLEADTAKEDKATLIDAVQRRLEEVLSKRNLDEDLFIQQHMNAQLYVPIAVLLGHHRIEDLGPAVDVAVVLEAAQRSEKLGVDEDHQLVRPLVKPRRNTLILHDLPEDITEEALQLLFKDSPETATSVKPDVNRTAFVSFQSDEAAQQAALWLRSQKLQGVPVRCSVKSEHFLRSFFPMPPASPGLAGGKGGMVPGLGLPGQAMMWMPQQQWAGDSGSQQWPQGGLGSPYAAGSAEMWADTQGWPTDALDSSFGGKDGKNREKGWGKGKGKAKGTGKQRSRGPSFDTEGVPMEMGMDSFAPVQQDPFANSEDHDDADVGYPYEFRRYTREEIIRICSCMEEVTKPGSYQKIEREEKEAATLFRQSPCKDWAPLPTPQLSFSPNFAIGDSRRGSAEEQHRPERDHSVDRAARKASSASASWPRSTRPSVSSEHAEESQNQSQQQQWDWGKGGEEGWSRSDSADRWKRRSWSGDWHGGQHWVEKPTSEEAASEKPQWAARPSTWVEKVRGSEKGGTPQKWRPRGEVEKDSPGNAADGASDAGTALENANTGGSGDAGSGHATAASPTQTASRQPPASSSAAAPDSGRPTPAVPASPSPPAAAASPTSSTAAADSPKAPVVPAAPASPTPPGKPAVASVAATAEVAATAVATPSVVAAAAEASAVIAAPKAPAPLSWADKVRGSSASSPLGARGAAK